ncbi:MAG: ABC transporter substrate-binding protein, partial [Thermodesulfobacteriota bacterium]|nr:ABC transporter substrate-binding protein [Thermodesulfobacteriota bacterium]
MKLNQIFYQICQFVGIVFIVFILTLLDLSSVCAQEDTRGISTDTVKIGAILDQTGPICDTSLPITEGMKNYIRHINDTGGIHGRRIKLIVEDDRYSIPMAVGAFKKLLFKDKVLAILGLGGTGQTKVLYPHMKKYKVPGITIGLTEDMIKPHKQYLFIPSATYEDEIKVIFKYIVDELRPKDLRMGFITLNIEYGKVGWKAAVETAKTHGIEIIDKEIINFGAADAVSQVLGLKKKRANVVILHQDIGTALVFLKSAKKLGYTGTFIGTYYVTDDTVVRLTGEAAQSLIGVHSLASWHEETPGMTQLREITLKYNSGFKEAMRNKFYTQGWVTALITAEGMKKAGRSLTIESLVNGIESLKNLDTGGITAPITYSKTSHKPG